MPIDTDTSRLDLVENWPYEWQYIDDEDDLVDLLDAFATELQRLDAFVDELYEQRFVETATGVELDKLGAAVGVSRETGESDERYRFRVRLGKAVAASDGTAADVRAILRVAFDAEVRGAIEVAHVDGAPVTRFRVPSTAIDDIPLTTTELEAEIERGFPCSHAVELVTDETFLLSESGSQGLSEGGLS